MVNGFVEFLKSVMAIGFSVSIVGLVITILFGLVGWEMGKDTGQLMFMLGFAPAFLSGFIWMVIHHLDLR